MVRDIDFHLKYCFSERNLKLTASGRNPRKKDERFGLLYTVIHELWRAD